MKFSRREVAKLAAVPILFHIAKSGVRPATAAQSGDGETREAVQAALIGTRKIGQCHPAH